MSEHRLERRARMLKEAIVHHIELNKKAFMGDNRYAFTKTIPPAMQLDVYNDPIAREQVMKRILAETGQAGVQKYLDKLAQIATRQQGKEE